MSDFELEVELNKSAALLTLAMGGTEEELEQAIFIMAEQDEFEIAEGYRRALEMWERSDKNHNCKVYPPYFKYNYIYNDGQDD